MKSLQRIILIDSYLPGLVEFKVSEHTNICGPNASGKTTLQRLLLVFYGELPSNVVPKSRDSFERWYLPRTSSYVIYEYINHQGVTYQVALSSSADGRAVNYRFIGKAYEIEDYIKSQSDNGAMDIFGMQELGRRLRSLGIECSTQLSTKEYRAIIQNDQNLARILTNSKEIRTYARQYSLCDSKHSLRHVEKLVRAIHTKSGKMSAIKTMVAAILEEDAIEPPSIRIKPENVKKWADEILVVEQMSRRQPEMVKLSQLDHEVTAIEVRLGDAVAFFAQSKNQCAATIIELKRYTDELSAQRKQTEQQWQMVSGEKNDLIAKAKSTYKNAQLELDQIDRRYHEYCNSGIERVQSNLAHLDSLRKEMGEVERQHRLLTEEHSDIEKASQARKWEISQHELKQSRVEQALLDKHNEARRTKVERYTALLHEEKHEQSSKRAAIKDRYQALTHALELEIQALKSQLQHRGSTEAELLEIEVIERKQAESDARKDRLEHELKSTATALKQHRLNHDKQLVALDAAGKLVERAEAAFQEARKLRFPPDASLLRFLRTESPDWINSLGKIIDPNLLSRSDLKPSLNPVNTDCYGVHLDLGAIDLPLHCQNDAALALKVSQSEESLRLEQLSFDALSKALEKSYEQMRDLEQKNTFLESDMTTANRDSNALKTEKSALQQHHKINLQARRALDQQAIDQKTKALKSLADEGKRELSSIDALFNEQMMEQKIMHEDSLRELDASIAVAEQRLKDIRSTAAANLKEAQQMYENTLLEKGVDAKRIAELATHKQSLSQTIGETEDRRAEVNEYLDWKARTLEIRKPDCVRLIATAKADEAALLAEHAEAERQRDISRDALRNAALETDEQLNKMNAYQRDAERLLQLLHNEATISQVDTGQSVNLAEFVVRVGQAEQCLLDLNKKREALKAIIDQLDVMINKSGASKLSEAWERSRKDCKLDNGTTDLHCIVKEIGTIFNGLLPQLAKSLLDEGRNYGTDIKNYYDVLADINNKIGAQAARITRHIEDDLELDGVTDSGVRIISKISSLDYWDDLNRFIALYQEWRDSGYTSQPSIEYIEAIKAVSGILSRNTDRISMVNLLDIEIRLTEGKSHLIIRTDQEMADSSSQGMAYMILCKFLLAFTRMLRGNIKQRIHWPIDELGTLHITNIEKLFKACDRSDIVIVGALPNTDMNILKLFTERYMINPKTKALGIMKPQTSQLAQRLADLKATEQEPA